jgi:hypothetical protein
MLFYASANLLINEISPLGIHALEYYNTGALIFCIFYGMVRYNCCNLAKKSNISEERSESMI